jgi:hypothetical protein
MYKVITSLTSKPKLQLQKHKVTKFAFIQISTCDEIIMNNAKLNKKLIKYEKLMKIEALL